MDFSFSEKENAFRKEVRGCILKELGGKWFGFFDRQQTNEDYAFYQEFHRKMGARRWLCVTWPYEYGGNSGTMMDQLIIYEEMGYCGAPPLGATSPMIGPAILMYGDDEQKAKYLPGIARGETVGCLGYSEPNAGSDLGSLQIRAEEKGDFYIVNGQKIFTSHAHYADICWLAARTDPSVPKHKGISMFVVELKKTQGIITRPLYIMTGAHLFNEVFFDNVIVPKRNLVGGNNNGWRVLTTALNYERIAFGGGAIIAASCKRVLEWLIDYLLNAGEIASLSSHRSIYLNRLAEMSIELEVSRLLAYKVVLLFTEGKNTAYQASECKLFTSEMSQKLANLGMQILGLYSSLSSGSKWAKLKSKVLTMYMMTRGETIGAGTSEIERNIISQLGLGMPRE